MLSKSRLNGYLGNWKWTEL